MRKLHEPLTLPKHGDLLKEILDAKISIKLHNVKAEDMEDPEAIYKARANHPKLSSDDLLDLLQRCYRAINEQREDPRKY